VRQVLTQVNGFVAAGEGRNALAILEAITERYVADWVELDDPDGRASAFFKDLGAVQTEAILTADWTIRMACQQAKSIMNQGKAQYYHHAARWPSAISKSLLKATRSPMTSRSTAVGKGSGSPQPRRSRAPGCFSRRRRRRMKFGIYSSIANPPRGEHLERCIDEVIAEAQLAEASGFDACFFGEHHQDQDGFLPSPLIVATAVAAQTHRMNVGTSVILLPLHHPVHVAEDVITLDLISKGRVILGVGIGYQAADFRAFAVPTEHRVALFEEGVEIIRKCWSGEPFSVHGAHYTLDNIQIRPRPFQTPAPPLWIGASVPAAARRAGRLGDAFVATPSADLDSTLRLVAAYRQAALQAGRQPQVVLMRDAWVARSPAEAAAVYGPEVMTAYRYYWQNRLAEFRNIGPEVEFTLENLAPNRLILGDPETCIREFQRWHEATGADYALLRLRHAHSGGPAHEKIMQTLKLFGDRVLPFCR
jgi:probable F420-dependent oxidoreductase